MHTPGSYTQKAKKMVYILFLYCFFFCFMEGVAFQEYFVSLPFALFIDRTLYVSFPGFVFLPCDYGLDFDISWCDNTKCY